MKTSFQLKTLVHLCAVATLTTAAAGAAMAQTAATDVTRGAVAVTTTMGEFNSSSSVSHVIDRSGLSAAYVNGATNFDAYASSATHSSASGNFWFSKDGTATGFLSFDLGAAYGIDGLAWFGRSNSTARVSSFKVYADNDSDPTNGNAGLLFDSGTFSQAAGSSASTVTPDVFSFSSIATARYLTIEIVSNAGATYSSLGEVVFRQTAAVAAVPEPETYALMGLGLLAIGFTQRRRIAQR